jgi:hypothetical protein
MPSSSLPPIPVIDVPRDSEPAVVSAMAEPARLSLLLTSARKTYTPLGLRFADRLTRVWAARAPGPYDTAVAAVDAFVERRGAYLLNHAYEWGCTSGVMDDPIFGGTTLLRTLDWPFDGLGSALVVTRCHGDGGPYLNVTWPGYVGVLSGVAPGRFSAAINQPPLPLPAWGRTVGWSVARARVWRSRAIAPSHLLRLAFDTCRSFEEAVALIRRTPICIPAIFTMSGSQTGDAVVIERTAFDAFSPQEPTAANHWASNPGPQGRPRNHSSHRRRDAMCSLTADAPDWSFGWLHTPILQRDTRLVMMANAASGRLRILGLEKTGPATQVLDIE